MKTVHRATQRKRGLALVSRRTKQSRRPRKKQLARKCNRDGTMRQRCLLKMCTSLCGGGPGSTKSKTFRNQAETSGACTSRSPRSSTNSVPLPRRQHRKRKRQGLLPSMPLWRSLQHMCPIKPLIESHKVSLAQGFACAHISARRLGCARLRLCICVHSRIGLRKASPVHMCPLADWLAQGFACATFPPPTLPTHQPCDYAGPRKGKETSGPRTTTTTTAQ